MHNINIVLDTIRSPIFFYLTTVFFSLFFFYKGLTNLANLNVTLLILIRHCYPLQIEMILILNVNENNCWGATLHLLISLPPPRHTILQKILEGNSRVWNKSLMFILFETECIMPISLSNRENMSKKWAIQQFLY